uniref:SGNH hydrolase-type esterase domain-containing protein n=1 Tax=Gasterosteus aculeatus aculeatus TaxID=481459 RepID=A0AAQ4QV42_GASAC
MSDVDVLVNQMQVMTQQWKEDMARSEAPEEQLIVIHVGGNDSRLRCSEVTKVNVELVCTYAKTMSDTVVFSGPLPNLTSDDIYSRMSSFRRWLSRWCPVNNVGFVDHWKTFWGEPGLIRRDSIHPTLDGAELLSKNLTQFLTGLNP